MHALLGDAARRESLSSAGYARAQEFTWAASAEAHMACYRRAAEQTAADVNAV
jgi:hypothetical protein